MLKAIVNGAEKDIVRIPMIGDGPATITGTDSVTFETDATSVIDYTIKGNLQQSGTPNPSSPIYPRETGERTENLFDADLTIGTINVSDGTESPHGQRLRSDFISKLPAGTYSLSANGAKLVFVYLYNTKADYYGTTNTGWSTLPYTFTTNSDFFVRIVFRDSPDHNMNLGSVSDIMLNSGSRSLPYEPYGYTLPVYHTGDGGQLFDETQLLKGVWDTTNTRSQEASDVFRSFKVSLPAGTYTVSFTTAVNLVRLICDGSVTQNIATNVIKYTITSATDNEIGFSFRKTESVSTLWDNSTIMLNSGSTPLPYAPYGMKTDPIYLSEPIRKIGDYVDSAGLSIGGANRKIKKMVLTGEEDWTVGTSNYQASCSLTGKALSRIVVCSHYKGQVLAQNGYAWINVALTNLFIMDTVNCIDKNTFKTYLQQQYSAGTPVTVWYVLATPTTETITMPEITTAKGSNTLSIGTTLSPSSTEVTYLGIKNTYKEGWEVRDNNDNIIWGANKTLESDNSSIDFKGYGLKLKDYEISGNMTQSGVETTINGTGTLTYTTNSNLIDYSITGNLTQSSTPVHNTPVYPQECGDRTKNIYNTAETVWIENTLDDDGNPTGSTTSHYTGNFTPVKPNTTYYISKIAESTTSAHRIYYYDSGKNWIGRSNALAYNDYSFTTISGCEFIQIQIGSTLVNTDVWMIAEGQIAVAFEPYGYTLPVSHTGAGGNTQTDPIYISEPIRKIGSYTDKVGLSIGGANRNIKKLVLTGDENWLRDSASGTYYADSCTDYLCTTGVTCMCSHYVGVENAVGASSALEGISFITNPEYYRLYVKDPNFNSLEAFVAFLKGQNTNGTPVTVWYVLATPETETISMPTISNVNGVNSLSIGTTLQPADISLTYSNTANPTPNTPIYPYECGDRTANLFYGFDYVGIVPSVNGGGSTNYSGGKSTDYIELTSVTITLSKPSSYEYVKLYIFLYDQNKSFIGYTTSLNTSVKSSDIIGYATAKYYRIRVDSGVSYDDKNLMLNTGSTVLPYEPYGYKLPITCAGITKNIYLQAPIRKIGDYVDISSLSIGGVNRRITKVVFSGKENIAMPVESSFQFQNLSERYVSTDCFCTHYQNIDWGKITQQDGISLRSPNADRVRIRDARFNTTDSFKQWLSDQYQNGTPVIAWFVSSVTTTETTTMPMIQTTTGDNTFSITTSLPPSDIEITGHIKQ